MYTHIYIYTYGWEMESDERKRWENEPPIQREWDKIDHICVCESVCDLINRERKL